MIASAIADPVSVIVADDHPMIASGLAEMIARQPRLRFDGWAANGRDAAELFGSVRPNIAIFDLQMPEVDGIEATRRVREMDPSARVIIFTSFQQDDDIRRSLEAGAMGYLLKSAPESELIRCISAVAAGSTFFVAEVGRRLADWLTGDTLSNRELQILRLVADGNSNKRIASTAGITEGTIKSHLKNIFRKLGASSRTDAVGIAMKRGVIRVA